MDGPSREFERYRELQAYVDWTDDDAARVASLAGLLEPAFTPLIEDFYDAIDRNRSARKVITGGPAQIERLKGTLRQWLTELFSGRYDEAYVARRWRVGWRHVEIGLDQVFTNVALSRMRHGLLVGLHGAWQGDPEEMRAAARSLNKLLDLELALIEDAYQAEHIDRQQRVERLATIGQVAGGVAHELRNPLNVVKTSVYYLLHARAAGPEKKEEHLRRIERHVELADGVITALSNFARLPVPNARPFPVADCVREALEANPLPDSVELETDFPDALPPVSADARQVQIVFANLIRNACDAMPRGGRLTLLGRPADGAVEVVVRDNGFGIGPDDLARVMEPLYTTKARGLGLGLAIARAILDKNRGGLRVTSEPGKGSEFVVRLPSPGGGDDGADTV
jgi:signal transduction histidine kinase